MLWCSANVCDPCLILLGTAIVLSTAISAISVVFVVFVVFVAFVVTTTLDACFLSLVSRSFIFLELGVNPRTFTFKHASCGRPRYLMQYFCRSAAEWRRTTLSVIGSLSCPHNKSYCSANSIQNKSD